MSDRREDASRPSEPPSVPPPPPPVAGTPPPAEDDEGRAPRPTVPPPVAPHQGVSAASPPPGAADRPEAAPLAGAPDRSPPPHVPPPAAGRRRPRRWRPLPIVPPPGARPGGRQGRLPRWLSVPVLVCLPLVALSMAGALVVAPLATLLPLPTFALVVAAFRWFDRLEPEPWPDRVHALLWGATVAIVVSGTINTVVAVTAGEFAATVVSAPIVEEAAKAAGLLWIATRRQFDSVRDGIVYAGWIAAGFAAVENVQYFALAAQEGMLAGVFLVRGVLSPFAHPLFTVWIGVSIARAVERDRSPWRGLWWGLAVAVALHAGWNLAATVGGGIAVLTLLAFGVLFVVTAALLVTERRRARRRLTAQVPQLAGLYGLTPAETSTFASWPRTLQVRRSLSRPERARFDATHAAIARIVALHGHDQPPTPQRQQDALQDLWDARAGAPRS